MNLNIPSITSATLIPNPDWKSRVKKILKRVIRKALAFFKRPNWYPFKNSIEFGAGSFIDPTVDFVNGAGTESRLILGKGASLGPRCELDISASKIKIGDWTIVHREATLFGDLEIGECCLVSKFFFASSGDHDAARPSYIRFNDALAGPSISKPIRIHDDVWVGYNVFIKGGLTIGKGAVIGAGAVVTRDVGPYQIVGGIPAKAIGKRFDFNPPGTIRSPDPNHLPYFYSGFDQRNIAKEEEGFRLSREMALVAVPEAFRGGTVSISGQTDTGCSLNLGHSGKTIAVPPGSFKFDCSIAQGDLISGFQHHRFLGIGTKNFGTLRVREIEFL